MTRNAIRCAWELTPKVGSYKGVDLCTLTGRPCIVDEEKARPHCTRAAQIRAFQAKHYPDKPGPAEIIPLEAPRAPRAALPVQARLI